MSSQTFTWNGYESELVGPLPAGATSVQLLSTVGLEAPGYLVVDPDVTNPQIREWIRFNTINGDTLENLVRGLAGSVGPVGVGSDHTAGSKIRAVFTKQNLDDLFNDIIENTNDLSGPGGHIPDAGDPHAAAGYVKLTTADARYLNLSGGTMQGGISMASYPLTNLVTPVDPTDAVNKAYADNLAAGGFDGNHASLTNVTADQHHTKYTDAEAVDAMGANNVNNDLNHDRYTDANAQSAMGATDDANVLNHNRYTDANAVSAMGANSNANDLNHNRYTDSEARSAVDNGTYLKLSGGTVTGSLTVNGTVATGLLTVDGNISINYASGQAQFVNTVSGAGLVVGTSAVAPNQNNAIDLGAENALEWRELFVGNINGSPAKNIGQVVTELVTWANGQAAGITPLA